MPYQALREVLVCSALPQYLSGIDSESMLFLYLLQKEEPQNLEVVKRWMYQTI